MNYCILQIVSKQLSEPIRSHKDLDKDSVPHYHNCVKFYDGLSKQLVHQGHVLDLFACALDQVMFSLLSTDPFWLVHSNLPVYKLTNVCLFST